MEVGGGEGEGGGGGYSPPAVPGHLLSGTPSAAGGEAEAGEAPYITGGEAEARGQRGFLYAVSAGGLVGGDGDDGNDGEGAVAGGRACALC